MTATTEALTGVDPQSLSAVAAAAAGALPSPKPLVLGPTDGSLSPGRTGTAVGASFSGAVSGEVVLIVDPDLEDALAAAEGGSLSVADAVTPALEAASASFGPAVLGPVEASAAADAVERGDLTWAPLVGSVDGEGSDDVLVWVGVALAEAEQGGSVAESVIADAVAAGPVRTEAGGLALLRDVAMTLTVELGRTSMPVRDLLALAPGSVVELDRAAGAPADLMVNGRLLARGEIVVVDEDYGLRITEIVDPSSEG